jgi:hypothetical protein
MFNSFLWFLIWFKLRGLWRQPEGDFIEHMARDIIERERERERERWLKKKDEYNQL